MVKFFLYYFFFVVIIRRIFRRCLVLLPSYYRRLYRRSNLMQTNIERSFCGFFFTCVFYKNVEGVRRLTPKWYSNARSATFEVRLPLGELCVCVIVTKTLSPLSRLYIQTFQTLMWTCFLDQFSLFCFF